uniref:Uncharacterized protein n=1 Tax=Panagrolaimus sp. ES5 TaxID=591445 RepID=A0AC34GQC0_9BILA
MDKLPIDIHSGKLQSWLISRRHCKDDWVNAVMPIRQKIAHAIIDMPENERILQLLKGSQIIDILKETEKDTKNIFGSYSSQRMKDWQEIVKLYEKDNIYLADAAQLLQRLVQYDIPAMNRQITKDETSFEDHVKKEEEYKKNAHQADRIYHEELTKLGIDGKNFRKEIIELTEAVVPMIDEIADDLVDLIPAVQYYKDFSRYTSSQVEDFNRLSLLGLIQNSGGQVTYYEYIHGSPPTSVERPKLVYKDETKVEDDIDFGDEGEIDFGSDEIDFGIDDVTTTDLITDASVIEGIARGEFGLSVFENPISMRDLKGELSELEIFLRFRYQQEANPPPIAVYLNALEEKDSSISSIKAEKVWDWKKKVDAIQTKLNNEQTKKLLKARAFPGYIDEIVEELEKLQLQENKYYRLAEISASKQKESQEAAQKSREQVKLLTNALIYLKENIEKDIAKKYGRECNIIGEIYNVLP